MTDGKKLIESNIDLLVQGINLLVDINDELYSSNESPHYKSGVGKHMRHIIDHYMSLVYKEDNKVNYDDRRRNIRVEEDRLVAINKMNEIIDKLYEFSESQKIIEQEIEVKSNEGIGDKKPIWSLSSVKRELQFLISHTVHHYALIAVILRVQGYQPVEKFGVAPSTLKHQHETSVPKKVAE